MDTLTHAFAAHCLRAQPNRQRRGITYSIVLLPVWSVGLAFFFMLIARRRYSLQPFAGVCALGIAVHITGDVITSFGTMIFAPFSIWRAQVLTTFIIDPYFTSILAGGLIASVRWKTPRRPRWLAVESLRATSPSRDLAPTRCRGWNSYVATLRLESAQVYALPQPLSPFNWMIVVEQPRIYHLAYVHLSAQRDKAEAAGECLLV